MLTQEQIAIRRHGVGASEVAALCGVHPYKTRMDVWLSKATKTREPLVKESAETGQTQVGSALEPALRELFVQRTAKPLAPYEAKTLAKPGNPIVLASPDGLLLNEPAGLELKVVSGWMAHLWEDGIPDFVRLQVEQNMLVTGLPAWYVAALIGGTDLRISLVQKDEGLAARIEEAIQEFWKLWIDGDTPPPEEDGAAKLAYLQRRYPGSAKQPCRRLFGEEEAMVEELATRLESEASIIEEAKKRKEALSAELCAIVGNDYGIEGNWGKFLWYKRAGFVDYKALAEHLAGGVVSKDLEDQFRGEAIRVPRLSMKKSRNKEE